MELAFQVAQNGIAHSVFKQSIIANNLSNLTTTSFKAKRAESGTFRIPGAQTLSTERNPEQGELHQTNRDLDLAIVGEGYFVLETDTGEAFTRAGNLKMDEDGNIVTPAGNLLRSGIVVPEDATRITVSPTGLVMANFNDGTTKELGQLELARFRNPSALIAIGDNTFIAGPNSGDPIILDPGEEGAGGIKQHFLEGSNVDEATEITNQIVNQRQFQANLKTFQIMNDLVGKAIDLTR